LQGIFSLFEISFRTIILKQIGNEDFHRPSEDVSEKVSENTARTFVAHTALFSK
jgi:hypothetical protein